MKDTMILRGKGTPSDKNLIRIEKFIMKEFKRRGK